MNNAMTTFDFHGDQLDVVQDEVGTWCSVRRVCEALVLNTDAQRVKLKGKGWATTAMNAVVAEDGKIRGVFCIHLDSLPMWLATIEPSRVAEHVRPKLELYQRECAKVLADHFLGRRGAGGPSAELMATLTTMAGAMTRFAEGLSVVVARLDAFDERLSAVESGASADGCIGPAVARALILNPLCKIAERTTGDLRHERAFMSARARGDGELRSWIGWTGRARSWANLPQSRIGQATVKLREMLARAEDAERARRSARQVQMFGDN